MKILIATLITLSTSFTFAAKKIADKNCHFEDGMTVRIQFKVMASQVEIAATYEQFQKDLGTIVQVTSLKQVLSGSFYVPTSAGDIVRIEDNSITFQKDPYMYNEEPIIGFCK